jgi:hypothetical protein
MVSYVNISGGGSAWPGAGRPGLGSDLSFLPAEYCRAHGISAGAQKKFLTGFRGFCRIGASLGMSERISCLLSLSSNGRHHKLQQSCVILLILSKNNLIKNLGASDGADGSAMRPVLPTVRQSGRLRPFFHGKEAAGRRAGVNELAGLWIGWLRCVRRREPCRRQESGNYWSG